MVEVVGVGAAWLLGVSDSNKKNRLSAYTLRIRRRLRNTAFSV